MKIMTFIAVLLINASVAASDFETAMDAYERQEYAAAAKIFRTLAATGDNHAQYLLGRLYAHGYGVVQDYVEAHKWFNLAASRGHNHAAAARDAIAERMNSSQIAEAQRLARNWRPADKTPTAGRPETYKEPSRDTVASIQRLLNQSGYNAGPADGFAGSQTRSAIRDYQARFNLPVDGRPSNELLQHMERSKGRITNVAPQADQTPSDSTATEVKRLWQRLLVKDNFADGNYTANPAWRVAAGEFRVESGTGLRTIHQLPRGSSPGASGEASPEELGVRLLGAILNEASRSDARSQPQAPTPEYAEIYLPNRISNAFAIQLTVGSAEPLERLEFGVYQTADRIGGYRLMFNPDEERPFYLVRVSHSGGSSIIESAKTQSRLERLRLYDVKWTRDRNGEMVIYLEGDEIIRAVDRAFMDPFDGFTLVNRGGDYGLRSIAVFGEN